MPQPPATNITALLRCTTKNLIPGIPPAEGAAPADMISAMLQVQQPSPSTGLNGMVTLTYALAEDQLMLGNYYDMTLVDGVAPVGKK